MYFRVGDSVFIRGLSLSAVVGKDVWHRDGKTQPVLIDLEMPTNIEVAAEKDSVSNTIHYGILCKAITKAIKARHFDSLPDLADAISQAAMSEGRGELGLDLTILLPKAHLHAEGVGIRRRQTYESDEGVKVLRSESDILVVKNLRISCIIGVNPHERLEKQMVVFNIRLYSERNPLFGTHVEVFRQIQDRVESSNYQTLEALVDLVAEICLNGDFADLVIVRAEKPSAVLSNEGTGVQIRRSNQGKLSNEQILGVVAMSQLP